MLGHMTVESRDNQIKQGIYKSEFNLIVIYLIDQEENEKRTNKRKEKDRNSYFQLAFANLNWHERCQTIAI